MSEGNTPPGVDRLLNDFGEMIRSTIDARALYAGGSLATGGYRAGVSDMDLVAIVEQPLSFRMRWRVRRVHRELIRRRPEAAKLHCVYVPLGELANIGEPHVTWAGQHLFRRPFNGIARAEIHRYGFVVFGPSPDAVIPVVTDDDLRAAVRHDLTGYWSAALRRPWIWLRDFYVDLSLLTLARAEVTLRDGELITKQEARLRLHRFGVPPELVDAIGRRRNGQREPMSTPDRFRRARLVHRIVTDGITRLTST